MTNSNLQEDAVEPLVDFLQKLIPLKPKEVDLVRTKFKFRLFRKRHYVLQEGDICSHIYFVLQGCLRMYRIDEKGTEHILQFAPENHWINDLGSFHGLKPSKLTIDALADSRVLQISREDLIDLYLSAPKFDRIFRVLLENSFVRLQERMLQSISSTAAERYQSFLDDYPDLSGRLSQVQIAAYLGITPEFLSRMRNRAAKSGKNNKH